MIKILLNFNDFCLKLVLPFLRFLVCGFAVLIVYRFRRFSVYLVFTVLNTSSQAGTQLRALTARC